MITEGSRGVRTEGMKGQITMGALRRGGVETVGMFYEQQYDRLVGLSTVIVGSRQTAEDIVQEVFTRSYRILSVISDDSNLPAAAYHTRAVVNLSRGRMRFRETREIPAGEMQSLEVILHTRSRLGEPFPLSVDPQDFVTRNTFDDLLVDVKSDTQRLILELAYIEDLSLTQIAELLDKPVAAVKTFLYRGREVVRHTLRREKVKENLDK